MPILRYCPFKTNKKCVLCLTDHPPQSVPLDKFLHVCLTLFPSLSLHTPEYALPFHSIFQNTRPSLLTRTASKQTNAVSQSKVFRWTLQDCTLNLISIHSMYLVLLGSHPLETTLYSDRDYRLHSRAPPPIKVILKYSFIHGLMNPSRRTQCYIIIIFNNVSQNWTVWLFNEECVEVEWERYKKFTYGDN